MIFETCWVRDRFSDNREAKLNRPKMWKVYVSRNKKFVWNDEVGRENEGRMI